MMDTDAVVPDVLSVPALLRFHVSVVEEEAVGYNVVASTAITTAHVRKWAPTEGLL